MDAQDFYEHPYEFSNDRRYFANGEWKNESVPAMATASRPTPVALKKVEAALEEEQKVANQPQGSIRTGLACATR